MKRPLHLIGTLTLALLVVSWGVSGPIVAQDLGSVSGTVTDEVTGEPLDDATVSLQEVGATLETDDAGRFESPHLPSGTVTLRVKKPGYSTVVELVEVSSDRSPDLEIQLPRMEAVLQELFVRGLSAGAGGQVYIVESEERHETAVDLLIDQVPAVRVNRSGGGVGTGSSIQIRGVKSIEGPNEPIIYVDGTRIDSRSRSTPMGHGAVLSYLESIPASQVERIQVLSGPAAASRFMEAANGVILVETVRGGDSGRR